MYATTALILHSSATLLRNTRKKRKKKRPTNLERAKRAEEAIPTQSGVRPLSGGSAEGGGLRAEARDELERRDAGARGPCVELAR